MDFRKIDFNGLYCKIQLDENKTMYLSEAKKDEDESISKKEINKMTDKDILEKINTLKDEDSEDESLEDEDLDTSDESLEDEDLDTSDESLEDEPSDDEDLE